MSSVQSSRVFAPGDKLGKYDLVRQIAIGGMAELYLARTVGIEGFEKLVVVKRLLPQYLSNARLVAMFLDEARLAATLNHPNIAHVYDIGREGNDYFFAMEYVHGEDLQGITASATEQGVPLSLDAALTAAAGLCAGLHYAHELQIVHRDVSPTNVLVSYDGTVKLVDFGIARAMLRPVTSRHGLKGKISYMSPEQCQQDAVLDRRSDVYSVGTMLYELTTGRLPFSGETEYAVLNQIVNNDVPAPSTIVPHYPVALEAILLRALARDPAERFATALQLQGAIEDFAHESRLRISPLVLARVMSTLFPARLEDWASAKAQGAFFVEQHVVRTLIESGRTPEPPTLTIPSTDLGGDTPVGQPPIETTSPSQPADITELVRLPPSRPVDVTELVRLPPSRTRTIAAPRRRSLWGPIAIGGALSLAVGTGTFLTVRSTDRSVAVPPTAPAPPLAEPAPPPQAVAPAPVGAPVATPPEPPQPAPIAKPKRHPGRSHAKPALVKPVDSKKEPKKWNPDSLFLPGDTDKH